MTIEDIKKIIEAELEPYKKEIEELKRRVYELENKKPASMKWTVNIREDR